MGCRAEWDHLSNKGWPVCTETREIKKIALAYALLAEIGHGEIKNHTGCLLPCKYTEYTLVEKPIMIRGRGKTLHLIWSRKSVQIEKESLLYPFSSFLAEFGGALGLFVGFSFMVFWDLVVAFYERIFRES